MILSGCTSVRTAQSSNTVIPLKESTLSLIDGVYKNQFADNEGIIFSAWSSINYRAKDPQDWKDLSVRIKVIEPTSILVELMDNNIILDKIILKGELRDGFFKIKRQWKADFRFVILWLLGSSDVKLIINENTDLIVIRQSGGAALLVAFPAFASESPVYETSYERITIK